MKNRTPDMSGSIQLIKEGGRESSIASGYFAHARPIHQERQDSYGVYFKDREHLHPGESCKADFIFLFSDHERFEIDLNIGDILELNEGARKIGFFEIEEIFNDKIKTTHNKG